ncbi:hypothetical protein Nepgr_004291 [Nepenthes gracilis]|uniref:Pathogenic type III effector avirulence factor Avr cleavage site n=1 Tax=Nepenthes gracilis TaxID=150966 RepID=A0AAD3S181_NEPGR|nr:hypothetical protein Nepgr_004291 [Nepenthes gracilis]
MEEFKRCHVPAFGSWDYTDNLPFTQCFESARQAGLLRYSYSENRDLYVAGDLYENDVVTPAVIVVPRRRAKGRYPHVKEAKKKEWGYNTKEPPSPVLSPPSTRPISKAVDEDLYKIPPELLNSKPRRKRGFGLFSSCLLPACA